LAGGIVSIGTGPDTIGGTAAEARNVISGNGQNAGIQVSTSSVSGPVIQGNYIGTDVTGTVALGNFFGIWLNFSQFGNAMIGGTTSAAANLISGNQSDGVLIGSNTRNTQILGNRIGTDITGTNALGNGGNGVKIINAAPNNRIGGLFTGEANTIAFNVGNGVFLEGPTATGNAIRANKIFANGGLGIDIFGEGVTPNDAGDGDQGPNNAQNFPVLTSVTPNSSPNTVNGTLNSAPNTQFRIDFYSNTSCDSSGSGEGAQFLETRAVNTASVET
jgi:titin